MLVLKVCGGKYAHERFFTSLQFHTKTPIMLVLKVCVGKYAHERFFTSLQFHTKTPIMLVLKVCVGKYAHERFFYLSSVSYQNSHHVSVKSLRG